MNVQSELLGTPTRTEQVFFQIDIEGKQLQKHKYEIETITNQPCQLPDSAHLSMNYSIQIEYLGRTAQVLEAILRLRQEGVLVRMNSSEVNYGKSLILEIGRTIEKLEELDQEGLLDE